MLSDKAFPHTRVQVQFAVVIVTATVCSFVSAILSLVVGIRLVKGRRGAASALININIFVTIVSLVCEFMLYGIGWVLMTMALNRFKDRSIILIFIVCTIIGGAFEYFVSWFMEVAFGATAWDYSYDFLGDLFGGRTCLLFASMFGVLGSAWIKLLLPIFLRLFNAIPWKWCYGVTTVCATLMLVNCVMTLQALDNWGARKAGHVPATGIEQFYAESFNDEYMASRFQSMTIDPNKSVRA